MPEKPKAQEQVSGDQKAEVLLEEVAELEGPIKKIIEKISDRIEKGEYGLVVGDDASGRIPTLILGNFIKKIAEKRGLPRPNVIFIPGKLTDYKHSGPEYLYTKQQEDLEQHLANWSADKSKRILIVTDTVLTGHSLRVLVRSLKDLGYKIDIGTVGVEDEGGFFESKRYASLGDTEIFSGEYKRQSNSGDTATPKIYQKHPISGVIKGAGDETSRLFIKSVGDRLYTREEFRDLINQSREDANIVANRIVSWYESRTK